ncbi:MAG: hypothetical protein EA397_19610 [Deltaproteobacteria bacterium]|nr:MAG: hypothetical protein EA397_19610 [Deltaproteobacteria bacterium]
MSLEDPKPRGLVLPITCSVFAISVLLPFLCCCGLCMLPRQLQSEETREALEVQRQERAEARRIEAERRRQARQEEQDARVAAKLRADAVAEARAKLTPDDQRAFCQVIDEYAERYRAAENDLQRGRVRTQRGEALRGALDEGKVARWTGHVKRLTTTNQGNVSIQITLPCERSVRLGTAEGELVDQVRAERGADTLIPHDAPIYDQLATLNRGDWMYFSGELIPHERDGFEDASFTEAGTMTGPYFLFRVQELHEEP